MKTEILAGLTTFMTMAYIIALNPNLLTNFDIGSGLWNAVFMATCIASAIGTATMAFLANKPFVMAPGMGLNSFFAVICGNIAVLPDTDYTSAFQAAICIILAEGIVFILLSVFKAAPHHSARAISEKFAADEKGIPSQEYFVYFKKKYRISGGKEPLKRRRRYCAVLP